jgi:type I restriction enzyme S subunit
MASLYGTGTTKKSVKQTTGIQNLDLANYLDERVAVPKEVEQRAIADFLDAETARIDALIAKKRRMIELLLSRRTVTTIYSVSGKLNSTDMMAPSSLPWLEELSAAWDEVLLRLVARLGSGHTPSRNHPEWWLDCAIPWITTGEVQALRSDRVEYIEQTREMISEIGLANSAAELHSEDTVVLCRTASAGYSGIMSSAMATSQDFATWTCGPLLRPRFLLLCLRAMREDLLGRLAMGSTHKTIYMPDIRSIRIPLPSMEEQDRVVEAAWGELARIDKAMTFLERQIVLLRERRQALITAAVTGEIGVPGVRK